MSDKIFGILPRPSEPLAKQSLSSSELATYGDAFQNVIESLVPQLCSKGSCFIDDDGQISPSALASRVTLSHGHVVNLVFHALAPPTCSGSLPPVIGELTAIEQIVLDECPLVFSIPSQLGRLHVLDLILLDGCNLVGTIPEELGFLTNLRAFDIERAHMHTRIPTALGRATSLERFAFDRVRLTGSIPTEMGKLANARTIMFHYAQLTGSIPSELGHNLNLEHIYLAGNSLTNFIPSELGRLTYVRVLDFSDNRLHGTFAWNSGLPRVLNYLSLERNRFDGSLPADLGRCERMQNLRAHQNSLSGQIPSGIGVLTRLLALNVGSNKLLGTIPERIFGLPELNFIALHANSLEGSIPNNISSKLFVVFLHSNRLKGTIPHAWKDANLGMLSLHSNGLQGHVPAMQFQCRYVPVAPLLTLHGNRLSCRLPRQMFELAENNTACSNPIEWRTPKIFIVPGNRFALPVPEWLPEEHRDKTLFADIDDYRIVVLLLLGVILIFVCFQLSRQRATSNTILARMESSYQVFLDFLLVGSFLTLFCLLPIYVFNANYLECSELLIRTTVAYLDASQVFEPVVGIIWFLFALLSHEYIHTLCGGSSYTSLQRSPSLTSMYWCMFVLVSLLFGLPGFVYVISKSVPEENVVSRHMGVAYFWCSWLTPFGIVLSDAVLCKFARKYSKYTRISYLQLLFYARALKWSLIPALVALLLHENCLGGWRFLSTMCFGNSFDVLYYDTLVLSTASVCRMQRLSHLIQRGRCSRSIVETLTPLLLKNAIVTSLASPSRFLISWMVWKHKLNPCFTWYPVDDMLLDVASWCQLVVVWSPFIPLMLPLAFFAMTANLIVFRFFCKRSNMPHDVQHITLAPVKYLLYHLPALSIVSVLCFSLESKLKSSVVSAVGLLALLFWQACNRPLRVYFRKQSQSELMSESAGTNVEIVTF